MSSETRGGVPPDDAQTEGGKAFLASRPRRRKTEPVTIVIDTREKEPYLFEPPLASVRRKLLSGDYSVGGLEHAIAVERKTLDDFVNTVMRGRERFYRELERLRTYEHRCIVVEAGLHDILAGRYAGGAHPRSIFGFAMQITVEEQVHVFCAHDRPHARLYVEDFLVRAATLARCAGAADERGGTNAPQPEGAA